MFYHFLPDRDVQARMAAKLGELEDAPRDDRYTRRRQDGAGVASGSRGAPVTTQPLKRKRRPADKDKGDTA